MKHILFKVKNGKENTWREWCVYLCAREEEAKGTMRAENCVYERSIMYERGGDHYVVGTILHEGEPKKADLNVAVNSEHRKMKEECLGCAIGVFEGEFMMPPQYEILYEFDLRNK